VGLWRPFAPWLGAFADAYGRSHLSEAQSIPATPAMPASGTNLQNVPGAHRGRADRLEHAGDYAGALEARWAAVSCRPFNRFARDHAARLSDTLKRSPEHVSIVRLHAEVDRHWQRYRVQSGLKFGDYGLLYQSYAPAFLPGSRDTAARAAAYHLSDLTKGASVLDLGCNTGFVALTAAASAREVIGIDHATALIAIAEAVRAFSGITNCRFETTDAATFSLSKPFDLVISAAVHGWIDLPLPDLARRLAALTAPGGAVLFESQGQRSTEQAEADFDAKVATVCEAGFSVERHGHLCDDGVNLRAFVVLRRSACRSP
jgi:2-polyprenyl-3-methyl-5-hydroxy-6-metoxy-1,4-benzoquinol methylase